MIKVLIADDHKIFRKGLKQTINDAPDMTVADEAADGNEVLAAAGRKHFDVIILDITMPGPGGIELVKQLRADNPRRPVLILSMHPEDQYAIRALKAGAAGYLTKEADEETLTAAVRKIYKGGKYITPSLAEKLAYEIESTYEKPVHETLSEREYQVMRMIAQGKSTGYIAEELNLSPATISTYKYRILDKMGLKNNAEIIHYAIINKLIE